MVDPLKWSFFHHFVVRIILLIIEINSIGFNEFQQTLVELAGNFM